MIGAVLLAALSACGGNEHARISPWDAIAEPCRLLAADDVADVLGVPVTAARERLAVGALEKRGCEYGAEDDDVETGSGTYGLVDTGWRPGASIVAMPRAEANRSLGSPPGSFEQIRGLGDQAFVVPPHESLFVGVGEIALVVDVGNYLHAHGSLAAHAKLRSDTRELAARAVARLNAERDR